MEGKGVLGAGKKGGGFLAVRFRGGGRKWYGWSAEGTPSKNLSTVTSRGGRKNATRKREKKQKKKNRAAQRVKVPLKNGTKKRGVREME